MADKTPEPAASPVPEAQSTTTAAPSEAVEAGKAPAPDAVPVPPELAKLLAETGPDDEDDEDDEDFVAGEGDDDDVSTLCVVKVRVLNCIGVWRV